MIKALNQRHVIGSAFGSHVDPAVTPTTGMPCRPFQFRAWCMQNDRRAEDIADSSAGRRFARPGGAAVARWRDEVRRTTP